MHLTQGKTHMREKGNISLLSHSKPWALEPTKGHGDLAQLDFSQQQNREEDPVDVWEALCTLSNHTCSVGFSFELATMSLSICVHI